MKLSELFEASKDPMYMVSWEDEPNPLFVPFGYFQGDPDYDSEDRAEIKKLQIGETLKFGDEDYQVTVERVKDGTPESPW